MKYYKYISGLVLCFLVLAACSTPSGSGSKTISAITIKSDTNVFTLALGATLQLSVEIQGNNLTTADKTVTWSHPTEDQAIATVNATTGLVTAGSQTGETTITATSTLDSSKTANVTITVTDGNTPTITSVMITNTLLTLTLGSTLQLEVDVQGDNLSEADKAVTWSSDNQAIAIVDAATGLVTAGTQVGQADITATSTLDSSKTTTVTITVTDGNTPTITSVVITNTLLTLTLGSTLQLEVDVQGDNLSEADKAVTWSSNNQAIATVDAAGLVNAGTTQVGQAIVTATSVLDTTKSHDVIITVISPSNDPCVPDNTADDCDRDNDGLTNKEEADQGTNPDDPDSDNDDVSDGDEVANGTDPNDPNSLPEIFALINNSCDSSVAIGSTCNITVSFLGSIATFSGFQFVPTFVNAAFVVEQVTAIGLTTGTGWDVQLGASGIAGVTIDNPATAPGELLRVTLKRNTAVTDNLSLANLKVADANNAPINTIVSATLHLP